MDRARQPPPIEEKDRSPATLLDRRELGEQRRRQGIPGLAAEIDELHGRHGSADARRKREPLETSPALGARRRTAVDGDGTLERRPLGRDRASVVARVRLLLERRVVLLVHDDEPEAVNGREDRGAGADDDGRGPRRDALPLVAPLGVAESRVQDRDAVAEARAEASHGLGRERDLRDEHDDASVTRERGRGSLEVDLGLAAAGRPMEENVRTACVECRDDPLDGLLLSRRELLGLGLASERLATRGLASWPAAEPARAERRAPTRAPVSSRSSRRARARARPTRQGQRRRRRRRRRRRLPPAPRHPSRRRRPVTSARRVESTGRRPAPRRRAPGT